MNNRTVIELKDISRKFTVGAVCVNALCDISFEINSGDFVALLGPSGSGKTTCLHILGCLDTPTAGRYLLNGKEVSSLNDRQLSEVRNRKIGFVFQMFNLLPRATASENIELPLVYANERNRASRINDALGVVGLKHRKDHKPSELSGGEQQRIAIARAIVNDPDIILADEPTGNLDTKAGREIMNVFDMLNSKGKTIVIVTHDISVAEHAGRRINFCDGRIV